MPPFQNINLSLISGYLDGLRPDPILTVTEWANTKRILQDTAALPGLYNSKINPYGEEIMNRLSVTDTAQKIYVKKSSQTGLTEIGNNWLGYSIDNAPSPFLYVMPTDAMMKDTSKSRIEKMIQSTPSLSEKVAVGKARDKGNTLMYKEFKGGFVKMVGANSPVGLASTAVRNVYMDEIDRYPMSVGGEGSAEGLAETRTLTFGSRKKILLTSTPTRKGTSAIDAGFENTGQRYYHVPCPFCGEFQILKIDQLRYGEAAKKYSDVKYECEHCNKLIDERFKYRMNLEGKWVAKYPDREDGIVYGYFINALYSYTGFYRWGQLLKERDECLNDIPKKIVFTNTKLGEAYEEDVGDKPDWEALFDRYNNQSLVYEANKPFASVAFITAGVDIQGDRIEVQITGWMKGKVSQLLDYRVLDGSPKEQEVWTELAKIVDEVWVREDGMELPLRLMAIDSSDGNTMPFVYAFAKKYPISKVIAIKGNAKLDSIFSPPKTVEYSKSGKKIGKQKIYHIGVSYCKSELYGRLKNQIDKETGVIPDGYCHFLPMDAWFYKSLTAEEIKQATNKRGYVEYIWVKKFERNEVLDTYVYARAAASIVGMDRWKPDQWDRETSKYNPPVKENELPKPKKVKRKSVWETRQL